MTRKNPGSAHAYENPARAGAETVSRLVYPNRVPESRRVSISRLARSEIDSAVDEAVEQDNLVLEAPTLLRVCLSPTRFLSLLEHPFLRNRFDMFSEIDEDKVTGVGGRVGEVLRLEPRGEIGVGAGEGALIPGEVGRQFVRV